MKLTPITGFLYLGPALLGPVERERAGKRSDERRDLHCGAARLEAEPVGEHHAQAGNLRHREIDEDNPAMSTWIPSGA
jgi:hypothetical protein